MKTNTAGQHTGTVRRPVQTPTGVTTRRTKRKHFYGSFKIPQKTKEEARLGEIIGR